jgi:hypothetical protein
MEKYKTYFTLTGRKYIEILKPKCKPKQKPAKIQPHPNMLSGYTI